MIKIRKMQQGDTEAIHNIHTACLTQTLAKNYSPEQIQAWLKGRTPQGYWDAALSGEKFLVLEDKETIIAYASWYENEVLSLFVHPDFQRRGHGSCLFLECSEAANQAGQKLDFVKAALGADEFYKRYGFNVTGSGFTEKQTVPIPDILMKR